MSRFRDSADRLIVNVLVGGQGEPAGARRVTTIASMVAKTFADSGHTHLAVTASVVGSALLVAEPAYTSRIPSPEDGYAQFTAEAPKRRWRR